jgi:hypothetical protein
LVPGPELDLEEIVGCAPGGLDRGGKLEEQVFTCSSNVSGTLPVAGSRGLITLDMTMLAIRLA